MKGLLEKLSVFKFGLAIIAFFGRRSYFNGLTNWLTNQMARLNLSMNQPAKANNAKELATTWQQLMPPDGKAFFKIKDADQETAFVEIHLHCPLRGSGDAHACHRLMNYDRQLMKQVGGQLIVLDSQSNSGKDYCQLAIRPEGTNVDDLIQAHLK